MYGTLYSSIPYAGMSQALTAAADFLAALAARWASSSDFAGLPPAYYGSAPAKVDPPYITIAQVSGKTGGRATGSKAYWEDKIFRFSVWHPNEDQAVSIGEQMIAALDPILDVPLSFANGYQMTFYRTGDDLIKPPSIAKPGTLLYQQTYLYRVRIGRERR